MALVIAGRIVPLDPADPDAVFKGVSIWTTTGRSTASRRGTGARRPASATAPVVDVGDAFVLPGSDRPPQPHRLQHAAAVGGAQAEDRLCAPRQLDAGGDAIRRRSAGLPMPWCRRSPKRCWRTSSCARWWAGRRRSRAGRRANREHVQVLRNIDDETPARRDHNRIYTSALTKKPLELAKIAQAMTSGAGFIYHCAEGQVGSLVAREFVDAANAGCLERDVHRHPLQRDRGRRLAAMGQQQGRRGRLVAVLQSVALRHARPTSPPPRRRASRSVSGPTGVPRARRTFRARSKSPSSSSQHARARPHRSRAGRDGDDQSWRRAHALLEQDRSGA